MRDIVLVDAVDSGDASSVGISGALLSGDGISSQDGSPLALPRVTVSSGPLLSSLVSASNSNISTTSLIIVARLISSSRRVVVSSTGGEGVSTSSTLIDISLWMANLEPSRVSISKTSLFRSLSRYRSGFLLVSQKQHPMIRSAIAAANPAPTPIIVSLA